MLVGATTSVVVIAVQIDDCAWLLHVVGVQPTNQRRMSTTIVTTTTNNNNRHHHPTRLLNQAPFPEMATDFFHHHAALPVPHRGRTNEQTQITHSMSASSIQCDSVVRCFCWCFFLPALFRSSSTRPNRPSTKLCEPTKASVRDRPTGIGPALWHSWPTSLEWPGHPRSATTSPCCLCCALTATTRSCIVQRHVRSISICTIARPSIIGWSWLLLLLF